MRSICWTVSARRFWSSALIGESLSRTVRFDCLKRKVFRVPYFDGGISYFGLAEVYPAGRRQYMADWLPNLINRQAGTQTLKEFAFNLRDGLNAIVPSSILKRNPSGIHVCGYNDADIPEFWFISNIGSMNQFKYLDLHPRYGDPTPDFLERDAKNFGWGGVDPSMVSNGTWIYRNGDIRAHATGWERLDKMFEEMSAFPDMRKLRTPEDLTRWVKFKFQFVAAFYKKFAHYQIIGTPIDVFCTSRNI
jgi:hypothetical protein